MGTIKGRKVKDLTEADEIKKKWQECTEELYKNCHKDRDRDGACVTQVKPDMLEYEVKWVFPFFGSGPGKDSNFSTSRAQYFNNAFLMISISLLFILAVLLYRLYKNR